jgi:hypothetical protein
MRTLLKITMDVVAANDGIKDGSLPQLMQATMEKLKPEAAYFTTMDGCRTALIVFDLKDPSEMPAISEPFFMNMHAKVEMSPVMDAEDLKKGLASLQSMKKTNA